VTGDAEAVVELAVEPLAPETGTVELQAIDEAGEPVEGQCFVLNSGTEQIGPLCDNGDRDADTAPGAVRVEDLPVGVYEAVLQAADAVPSDPDVAQATQRFIDRRTFTVERGGPVINVVVNVLRQRPDEGDLQIAKRDEAGRPLGGACFAVRDGGRTAAEVCDNERGDADGNVGGIRIQDLREGSYTLVETRAPQGYERAADQPLRIAGDQTLRVTVRNTQVRDQTGELIVRTVDPDGDPVNGACYTLFQGARPLGPVCDDADGDDGEVTFGDLRPGAYLVRQTRTPAGYLGGNDTAVRVLAGERIEVEVVASPRPGSVLIRKTDDGGRALANACFSTIAVDGGAAYEVCDNDQNDANPAAGLILLNGIAAGDYDVRETRAPAGYRAAADRQVNVAAGARTDVTVRNSPLPPPAQRGSLVVTKTDADDRLLAGACWALLSGDVSAAARCDGDDGARDGIARFDGVGVGRYTLRETVRPSAAYEIAADTTVDVALDRTTRVSVVNELRPGRVLVRKTNPNGEALAGACFDLEGDNAGALCTDDADGRSSPTWRPGSTAWSRRRRPPATWPPRP
jgi:uncharacterized surface anchored protein